MISQYTVKLPKHKRGYHIITDIILNSIEDQLPEQGLLNVFIQHTSAALTINENADPSVRDDFESSFNHLIKENEPYYTHIYEGDDDMPAHIKSSIMGASLVIPITNRKLNLGIWQGIYLCEFRNNASPRTLIITVYS